MNRFAAILGALALTAVGTSSAQAQSATGTLTFLQPDGIVGPNDHIPVNARLTLDGGSSTLTLVDGAVTSGGPSDQQLIDRGFNIDGAYFVEVSYSALCSGSFFPPMGCGPPPYEFNFGTGLPRDFTLQAGDSIDFNFANFTPQIGGVADGFYNFYTATVVIQAYRFDANNNFFNTAFDVATSCTSGDDSCDFSRTVQGGIPEPGTWALMIGGFGLAGAALRRRRATATA